MFDDPIVDEIHKVREKLWEEIQKEPGGIVAYFKKKQVQYPDRVVSPEETRKQSEQQRAKELAESA